MNETETISIIVPVYKVENWLLQCIDSLVNQTYRNLEIILVDDGSPDECPKLCDEAAKEDSRIIVIHKENGGLSDARNVGLKRATGQFVAFIDSDDRVHYKWIEMLYNLLKETNSDIAQCQFVSVDSNKNPIINTETVQPNILTNIEALEKIESSEVIQYTVVWNKLYRMELFDNILFPVGRIHEDESTTYKLFYKAKKIVTTDIQLYFYFQSPSSIIRSAFTQKKLDFCLAYEERILFFKEKQMKDLFNLGIKRYSNWILATYYKHKTDLQKLDRSDKYLLNCLTKNVSQYNRAWDKSPHYYTTLKVSKIAPYLFGFFAYHKIYKRNFVSKFAKTILGM